MCIHFLNSSVSYGRWRIITFKFIIAVPFLLGIIAFMTMYLIARERNVNRHRIEIEGNPKTRRQLTIFFITDIHKRTIDHQLIKKIGTDIDMVIIGGDFAEKGVPLSRVSQNIERLSALGQVFFVWGNNDREIGEANMRKVIQAHSGIILDNENQSIPGHESWAIAGTDDPSWKMANPEKALLNTKEYAHVLFVSHQPVVWNKAEKISLPTLMLAGHTHGGQIRLGKYGIDEPGYFKWDGRRGKLISNGYGTTTIPLRFGAHPECHVIQISY